MKIPKIQWVEDAHPVVRWPVSALLALFTVVGHLVCCALAPVAFFVFLPLYGLGVSIYALAAEFVCAMCRINGAEVPAWVIRAQKG